MKTSDINWYNVKERPTFHLIFVSKRYNKLFFKLQCLLGLIKKIDIQNKDLICKTIIEVLKVNEIAAIQKITTLIINYYLGREFTIDTCRELAAIVSGNYSDFLEGKSFVRWNGISPVWVGFYVRDISRAFIENDIKYKTVLDVHFGPAAGISLTKFMTKPFCNMLLQLNFKRKKEDLNPLDIGGLWFAAILTRTKEKYLAFNDIHLAVSMCANNLELLKGRRDLLCTLFNKGGNCFNCPLGRDLCKYARHERSYKFGKCINTQFCHKGYIVDHGYCMVCLQEGAFKIKERNS